ncbi:SDR family oxidoreductase [Runella zeae]|uniref:SDR family oxidoreductase n=1 Tax=Runella zeae TaxID=94255 RepID=UPI000420E0E0|nr:SDR family oxidoreductase [Runella zeae]
MKISILGCGWLGLPLGQSLLEKGYVVRGSTTRAEKLSDLRAIGIEPLWLQLTPEPKGIGWDYLLDTEVLIINVPPRLEKAGAGYHVAQMRHLKSLVETSTVQKIIYVSSTSVYGDLNREVSEQEVTIPSEAAAPALVEAEQLVQQLGRPWLVLRCGGLMGYERIPAKYVAGKKDIATGEVPVNYVHRDDVIGVIEAFLQNTSIWNEVYNVVAPLHPTRREVYISSGRKFGYEAPTFVSSASPNDFKIISSQKLTTHLGYSFKYSNPLDFYYGQ